MKKIYLNTASNPKSPKTKMRFFKKKKTIPKNYIINEYIKMLQNGLITIDEIRTEMGYEAYGIDATNKPIIKQGFEFVEDIGTTELLENNQAPEDDK